MTDVAIRLDLDAHETFRQFRQWAENTGAKMLDVTPSGNSGWMGRWVQWCEQEARRTQQRKSFKPKIFAWDEDGRQVTYYGEDGLPRYD